ncbi:uncharacterized protein LOC105420702, partial [Amborella trichopoda]|uniref:uncharacterized protein LOC105420702 n=1 Tax=Amborella trichopoda TaxID=13333 RepID=UPI0005D3467E
TDGDLDKLKGCIELGFLFDHEHEDCTLYNNLPTLDLYHAMNIFDGHSSSFGSPNSSESWNIFTHGDNLQYVKTRLRHWAQAVACSVRQIC